jgi:hypothetical protein
VCRLLSYLIYINSPIISPYLFCQLGQFIFNPKFELRLIPRFAHNVCRVGLSWVRVSIVKFGSSSATAATVSAILSAIGIVDRFQLKDSFVDKIHSFTAAKLTPGNMGHQHSRLDLVISSNFHFPILGTQKQGSTVFPQKTREMG